MTHSIEVPEEDKDLTIRPWNARSIENNSFGAEHLVLPQSAGFDQETEDPYYADVQGSPEDFLPQEIIENQPEVISKLQEYQTNPIPEDETVSVTEDASTLLNNMESIALRDSQQKWYKDWKNNPFVEDYYGENVSFINHNELERAIIEAISVHSGVSTEFGIQEKFDPSVFMDMPPAELSRIENLSQIVLENTLSYMDGNPEVPWYKAVEIALINAQRETGDINKVGFGWAWDAVANLQLDGGSENGEAIKKSVRKIFDFREWFKEKQSKRIERDIDSIYRISEEDFVRSIDQLDYFLRSEDRPTDPLGIIDYEMQKASHIRNVISYIISTVPESVTESDVWTPESRQLGIFLVEAQRLGLIKDATDLEGSLKRLNNIHTDLYKEGGYLEILQQKREALLNPEVQYKAAMVHYFNKELGNRFDNYGQVISHVKDILQNKEKYPAGYRINALDLYNSTHDVFSELFPKAKDASELDIALSRIMRNYDTGETVGRSGNSLSTPMSHAFWQFFDPTNPIAKDTTGRAAEVGDIMYGEITEKILNEWRLLSGEEEVTEIQRGILGTAFTREGANGSHFRINLEATWKDDKGNDIPVINPIMFAAISSAMFKLHINNPTANIPIPILSIREALKEGIEGLNDVVLWANTPEGRQLRMKAHTAIITFRSIFGTDTNIPENQRIIIQKSLGLDKKDLRNIKLFNDLLGVTNDEYWANPLMWYIENEDALKKNPDLLLTVMTRGKEVIDIIGIGIAAIFEDRAPDNYKTAAASRLFGGRAMNTLVNIPVNSKSAIKKYNRIPDKFRQFSDWDLLRQNFEKAGIVIPIDDDRARAVIEKMLGSKPEEGGVWFGVNELEEDIDEYLYYNYPQYMIAAMLSTVVKNPRVADRLHTMVDAVSASGTSYQLEASHLWMVAGYLTEMNEGVKQIGANAEGGMVFTAKNLEGRVVKEAKNNTLPNENIDTAIGRMWNRAGGDFYAKYEDYLRTSSTMTRIFTIADDSESSTYWSSIANQLNLTDDRWNEELKTIIEESMASYHEFFYVVDMYDSYKERAGENNLPGNKDFTLDILRRLFEKYPSLSIAGLNKDNIGGFIHTSILGSIYTNNASLSAISPSEIEFGAISGPSYSTFKFIIPQGPNRPPLEVPLPISMLDEDWEIYDKPGTAYMLEFFGGDLDIEDTGIGEILYPSTTRRNRTLDTEFETIEYGAKTVEYTGDTKESLYTSVTDEIEVAEEKEARLEKEEWESHYSYLKEKEGLVLTPINLFEEPHKTVGVGHYLDGSSRDRAAVKEALPEIDYEKLRTGQISLNEEQAFRLFKIDIKDKYELAREITANFDTYSNNLKTQILSATFRGSWVYSKKARKLLAEGRFKEAADEFLNSQEYRDALKPDSKKPGIAPRMEAVAEAIVDEEFYQEQKKTQKSEYKALDQPDEQLPGKEEEVSLGEEIMKWLTIGVVTAESLYGAGEFVNNKKAYDIIKKNMHLPAKDILTAIDPKLVEIPRKLRWVEDVKNEIKRATYNKTLEAKHGRALARKRLAKTVSKFLAKIGGKFLGKVVPPVGLVSELIFLGHESKEIAKELTKHQQDVIDRVRNSIANEGISETEALIYHQLGAFSRSPGTKF